MTLHCRTCGREFSEGEQFCSQDGTRLRGELAPDALDEEELPLLGDSGDPLVGTTLGGRYRILRVIGEGGMGVVYEALHVLIEKHVAIKVLRDTFTGRVDVVERFRQEAKSASKIGHPNIVDVSDFGETPSGQSYIVMEMLIGEDLADMLARERSLPPLRAVRIAYQIARALHATHRKNIVHRDLKPENIYLVERDGVTDVVKIVDFGVAKMNDVEVQPGRRLTRTGMLFGTPEYMSPEQSLGKPFDHRVDIYALGAILFELVAGRVPFTGDNFMEILAHHGHSPLPSLQSVSSTLQVSAELEAVIRRALAKDPADRYPTMGAFADDLRLVPEMQATGRGELGAQSSDSPVGRRNVTPPPLPVPEPEAPLRFDELDDEAVQTEPRLAFIGAPAPPPAHFASYGEPQHVPAAQASHAGSAATSARSGYRQEHGRDHDHDLEGDIDAARDAVLLSHGSGLTSAVKVGLALVVVASGLFVVGSLPRGFHKLPTVVPQLPEATAFATAAEAASASSGPKKADGADEAADSAEDSVQAMAAAGSQGSRPSPETLSDTRTNAGNRMGNVGDMGNQLGSPAMRAQGVRGTPNTAAVHPEMDRLPSEPSGGVNDESRAHRGRPTGSARARTWLGATHGRGSDPHESSSARPNALMTQMTPGRRLEPLVEVQVHTVPRSASVVALGTDARCDSTPCTLLVPRDRAVTLRAEARNTSVQRTYTFAEESSVELRLSGQRGKSAAGNPTSTLSKAGQAPHAPSDLKVPSIFRER